MHCTTLQLSSNHLFSINLCSTVNSKLANTFFIISENLQIRWKLSKEQEFSIIYRKSLFFLNNWTLDCIKNPVIFLTWQQPPRWAELEGIMSKLHNRFSFNCGYWSRNSKMTRCSFFLYKWDHNCSSLTHRNANFRHMLTVSVRETSVRDREGDNEGELRKLTTLTKHKHCRIIKIYFKYRQKGCQAKARPRCQGWWPETEGWPRWALEHNKNITFYTHFILFAPHKHTRRHTHERHYCGLGQRDGCKGRQQQRPCLWIWHSFMVPDVSVRPSVVVGRRREHRKFIRVSLLLS